MRWGFSMQLKRLFHNRIHNVGITESTWYQQRESDSINRLLQLITAEMRSSLLVGLVTEDYPWCFVTAERNQRSQYILIGAFIRKVENDAISFKALYLRVSHSWLVSRCQIVTNPAFILSRALLVINTRFISANQQELNKFFQYLQRNIQLLSCKQLKLEQQKSVSEMFDELVKSQCDIDDKLVLENGVEGMPWRDWPDCLQHNNTVWLWRQSKYKKYIEVQKITVN